MLDGVDAMLASVEPLTRDVLARSKLRAIARMGVGYDAIDIPAATDLGIAVTITPGTLEESVAEHTVALMLGGHARPRAARSRSARRATGRELPMPRMAGKTFGIVGLGRIGRAVVPKVQGLGHEGRRLRSVRRPAIGAASGVTLMSLSELLQTADVVSLHPPTTPETINLINRQTLAQMKPGAVLINTARGAVLDEDALCEALDRGQLVRRGARCVQDRAAAADEPAAEIRQRAALHAHGRARLRIATAARQPGGAVHRRSLPRPLAGSVRGQPARCANGTSGK